MEHSNHVHLLTISRTWCRRIKILKIKDKFNLNVVSEIVNPNDFEVADEYLDVFQIGARNMQNFELLKKLVVQTNQFF